MLSNLVAWPLDEALQAFAYGFYNHLRGLAAFAKDVNPDPG